MTIGPQGSTADPVGLDPFQDIIEVGWGGKYLAQSISLRAAETEVVVAAGAYPPYYPGFDPDIGNYTLNFVTHVDWSADISTSIFIGTGRTSTSWHAAALVSSSGTIADAGADVADNTVTKSDVLATSNVRSIVVSVTGSDYTDGAGHTVISQFGTNFVAGNAADAVLHRTHRMAADGGRTSYETAFSEFGPPGVGDWVSLGDGWWYLPEDNSPLWLVEEGDIAFGGVSIPVNGLTLTRHGRTYHQVAIAAQSTPGDSVILLYIKDEETT